jgi:hypothetical protein
MIMRIRRVFFGVALLAIMLAAIPAAGFLADYWGRAVPLEITDITVARGRGGAEQLVIAGPGVDPSLTAILLPAPPVDHDNADLLTPHLVVGRLDSGEGVTVASSRGRRVLTLAFEGDRPRVLGSVQISNGKNGTGISSLVKMGSRAVVALNRRDGLVLVDLSDPYVPREMAVLPLAVEITDMQVVNGQIIAAGVKSGLWQVTIDGDRLRASRLPGMSQAWRLAREGNRLVAASLQGDLAFYQTDGTNSPRLVGQLHLPGQIRGVVLRGDRLYVSMSDGSLSEYAAVPWPMFVARGHLQLPGKPLRLATAADSPYLLSVLSGIGLAVVDISRPGEPAITGWLPSNAAITDLHVAAGRVLLASTSGLQLRRLDNLVRHLDTVFPLGTPLGKVRLLNHQGEAILYDETHLLPLGNANTGSPDAALTGDEPLLALPAVNGVRLYARRAGRFVQVAHQPVAGPRPVVKVLMHKGRLFVLTPTALEVFSCDANGACRPGGRLEAFADALDLDWVEPGYLLVNDRDKGLELIAVGEADVPRIVAELPVPAFFRETEGSFKDVVVSGRRAYVARGRFGVQVVDLSALPAMKVVQLIDTPGLAMGLTIHDDLLLVTDRGEGIQVLDIRAGWCRLLGSLVTNANPYGVAVQGKEILFSTNSASLVRLPAPVPLGTVQTGDAGLGQVALPAGLPAGRYQLVVYDARRLARADFTLQ